jgi:hypothetical protein
VDIEDPQLLPPGWEPKAKEYVCLSVADNGWGMDGTTLDKIFDPSFSTKFTGRGLGLPVVLGLVRGLDGAIAVRSRAGDGAIIKVFLPVSERTHKVFRRNDHPKQPQAFLYKPYQAADLKAALGLALKEWRKETGQALQASSISRQDILPRQKGR